MRMRIFVACAGLVAAFAVAADPVGSSFTYQGQLTDQGAPANGQYDLRFALFTAASGGTAVDTLELDNQAVSGGLLNATLDFTDAPYNGQALWVEVGVRTAGSASFTTLAPRQTITATPYALFALSGNPGPQGVPGPPGPPGVAGPPGPSLSLPYAQTVSSLTAAFTIGNSADGIEGDSSGSGNSGVYGRNTSSGKGVFGSSESGEGVAGTSTSSTGVGVNGTSLAGIGVLGLSQSNYGVVGSSTSGTGVHAESSGAGLLGPALDAVANSAGGIAILANATSTDATAVFANGNPSGTILKGLGTNGATEFQVSATGEVSAHGAFHPNGVDYSDRLPASTGLEPGDVVAIGSDGLLHRTTSASESDVAGVYSTKPGVVGQREEERHLTIPVALAGVIPVKASAENGAIRAGDLLVSSSMPGRAMRAPPQPQAGSVIGKAMQPLGSETGDIEMLVMLR